MKLSELTEDQKSHLAWRLDHKTYVGAFTAARIARGEFGDLDLVEIFVQAGKSKRSAMYHARAVARYGEPEEMRLDLRPVRNYEDWACPECGEAKIYRATVPCPDGIPDCAVLHWGYCCDDCGSIVQKERGGADDN